MQKIFYMEWLNDYLFLSYAILGLILGIAFQKIFINRLRKLAQKTKWEGDDIIINSLKGWIIVWFALAGIYISLKTLEIQKEAFIIINKIFFITLIFSITFVAASISAKFVGLFNKKKQILPASSILETITFIFVLIIGILIIFNHLGISISPLIASLGIGGLAVALALQDTLTNLFSGFYILISKKIRPGDFIEFENNIKGFVEDITLRYTTLRDLEENLIIIPNSKLSQSIVKNYHLPYDDYFIIIPIGISYKSDLEFVEKITIETVKNLLAEYYQTDNISTPILRYHTFNNFSIDFNLIVKIKNVKDQGILKHLIIKEIKKAYEKYNIEIPYPITTVVLSGGDYITKKVHL